MKNVSNVLLDYVYAVIYLYRGEKLCNIMHHLKVQRTILKKKKKLLACGTLIPCIMSSYLYFYH